MKNFVTSKTPLRIGLLGGGSDLESYFEKNNFGSTISASINKYIYITVHKRYDDLIRASYSKTEIVDNVKDIKHELIRESLKYLNIKKGIEVVSISDVTGHGTGLGSSSSYTVGLINAISALTTKKRSRFNLANDACKIEIDLCGHPIGKQDQFAASFGGLNEIIYKKENINVIPLNISSKNLNKLSENLLLFDTGIKRKSSKILSKQTNLYKESKKLEATKKMVDMVPDMKKALLNDIDLVGEILDESWKIKKSLVGGIANKTINSYYSKAMKNGAIGGKLCGAGGGGFLLLYCKKENHNKLRKSLSSLKELNFEFDYEGASLL